MLTRLTLALTGSILLHLLIFSGSALPPVRSWESSPHSTNSTRIKLVSAANPGPAPDKSTTISNLNSDRSPQNLNFIDMPETELSPDKSKRSSKINPPAQQPPNRLPDPPTIPQAEPQTAARQRTKPPPSSSTVQTASGSSAAPPTSRSASADSEEQLLASYTATLIEKIRSQLSYPSRAARKGQQGTTVFQLEITSTGRINQLQLHQSSGHQQLDQAARRALQSSQPWPPLPAGLTDRSLIIKIPVQFQLD